jgi:asparagine synthase (glutamine-hydrolysing)
MIGDVTEEQVEKSIWHLDEPMTDLSAIPMMLICAEAHKSVKVCMSGEGGDEVFCGYDRFKASKINRYYSLLPRVVREKLIGKLVARLADRPEKKGPVNLLKRFIEGSLLPAEGRHLRWQYFLNPRFETDLFTPAFKAEVNFDPFAKVREYDARCNAVDTLNRELYLDLRFEMTDSLLMKADKMSMAHALEVRVPLLDHLLVEYVAGLPGKWKLDGFQTKAIFRKALLGMLPKEIIYRGKQGFSLPVKHLLRGQLKDYMRKLLNETPVIRENMNMPYVNQLIAEHLELKHNHNHVLWGLMNIAIWHRRFFGTDF